MKQMTKFKVSSHTLDGSLTIQGWMRTEHVADYLGTSQNNVRNMIYRGLLSPKKFGGRLYFKREEIDHLIEAQGV
jgi:excisionase family DNA binding protein